MPSPTSEVLGRIDQVLTAAAEARTRLDDAVGALEKLREAWVAQEATHRRQREARDQEILNLHARLNAAGAAEDVT